MMGKSQKVKKGRPVGFVPDYRHAVETVGESEVFASPTRIDSEDSCAPNPKSTTINATKTRTFDVPLQYFPLSKLSPSEKKELESRLRGELERVRIFQKRFHGSKSSGGGGARSSAKKEENTQQKNPKSDRVNASKPVKPAITPTQPPPPSNKPQLSNNHVMVMKQCETLLKRLMAHQYAWVFNVPVDVVKLNIPDYFQVIKHPMDLGTVKEKLGAGSYSTPSGFASDVRLTFSNAMAYNPAGNDVHVMADVMSKFFEARWKPIEKKLVAIEQPSGKREAPVEKKQSKAGEAKGVLPKKRKAEPQAAREEMEIIRESPKKRKMTSEQKIGLSRRLESIVGELPDHIIEFLKRNISNESQSGDDEIEIDIDSLGDETLFELERLLDEFMREREREREAVDPSKNEHYEVLNESGLSNSSMHEGKGHEPAEEEIDIGGDEPPVSRYSPVVIEKEETNQRVNNNKGDTSSSSSDSSASSSHDSDSSSSSGSGSDAKGSTFLENKEKTSGLASDREKKSLNGLKELDADDPLNTANSSEMDAQIDGENGSSERQVSPGKQYRAALLRGRFADTILKAREKTLDQVAKKDPQKLRREREELERLKREEKARLQAEAKVAEEARKRAEAEEAKRRRAEEREAARRALQQMEKTVELDEGNQFMRDLEMLRTAPEHNNIASSVGETSPMDAQDGPIGPGFRPGSNPLEQLGLFMKADEDEDDEPDPNDDDTDMNMRVEDVEEGEID